MLSGQLTKISWSWRTKFLKIKNEAKLYLNRKKKKRKKRGEKKPMMTKLLQLRLKTENVTKNIYIFINNTKILKCMNWQNINLQCNVP